MGLKVNKKVRQQIMCMKIMVLLKLCEGECDGLRVLRALELQNIVLVTVCADVVVVYIVGLKRLVDGFAKIHKHNIGTVFLDASRLHASEIVVVR